MLVIVEKTYSGFMAHVAGEHIKATGNTIHELKDNVISEIKRYYYNTSPDMDHITEHDIRWQLKQ